MAVAGPLRAARPPEESWSDLLAAGDVRIGGREHRAVGNVSAGARHGRARIANRRWRPTSASWQREAPDGVSPRAISRAFGTPKPTLANSYQPELLNLRTFPTLMGYSSRILAESWESNLLYYAALADEIHVAAGGVERAGSGVDPADRGTDFRHAPGRLAGAVALACAWWATMSGKRPASRWQQRTMNYDSGMNARLIRRLGL